MFLYFLKETEKIVRGHLNHSADHVSSLLGLSVQLYELTDSKI